MGGVPRRAQSVFTQSTSTNGQAVSIPSDDVCDAAGNCVSLLAGPYQSDALAPSLHPSVCPNPVLLNGSASATPNDSDATSVVASSSCDSVGTSSVGVQSVSCSATDNAGDPASASAGYTVTYQFSDFASPIDGGVLNVAKAARSSP